MAKAKKKLTVTYENALEAAYEFWVYYYDEREHYDAVKGNRSHDWREYMSKELRVMANGSCTAEWMLCDMFGLSEERVHEDLVALRAKIRETMASA